MFDRSPRQDTGDYYRLGTSTVGEVKRPLLHSCLFCYRTGSVSPVTPCLDSDHGYEEQIPEFFVRLVLKIKDSGTVQSLNTSVYTECRSRRRISNILRGHVGRHKHLQKTTPLYTPTLTHSIPVRHHETNTHTLLYTVIDITRTYTHRFPSGQLKTKDQYSRRVVRVRCDCLIFFLQSSTSTVSLSSGPRRTTNNNVCV